jgi:hypothetical protein
MQNPYNIQNVVEGLVAQGELVCLFNPMLKRAKVGQSKTSKKTPKPKVLLENTNDMPIELALWLGHLKKLKLVKDLHRRWRA